MLVSDLLGHVPTTLGTGSGRTGIPIQVHLWPLLFQTHCTPGSEQSSCASVWIIRACGLGLGVSHTATALSPEVLSEYWS